MSRLSFILLLAAGFTIGACASSQSNAPSSTSRIDAQPLRPAAGETVVVDHLLVIVDASESVDDDTTFIEERTLVESFVASTPDGNYEAGAVAFGGFRRVTIPLAPFDRTRFQADTAEIEHLRMGTPLYKVLDESKDSLGTRSGTAAVVIFSDGVVTDEFGRGVEDERVLASARELSVAYDGTVCFHTVQVGESEEGTRLLRSISEVTDCGTTRSATAAANETQLLALQRDVFIGAAPVADTSTLPPVGAAPPTRQGAWSINFGFDSATVDSSYGGELGRIATEIDRSPDSRVRIQGHTDTSGDADYNRQLSLRRAEATRDALVEAGVDASRIDLQGYGEDAPLFADDSESDNAANRRTDIEIVH